VADIGEAVRSRIDASALTLVSHGARIRIGANLPGVANRVMPLLPGAVVEPFDSRDADVEYELGLNPEGSQTVHRYTRAGRETALLVEHDDTDVLLTALVSDAHFQIALHARPFLFVHAGVVEWRGRAILIPGRSMTGKTSLVAALVRAGASYYSDEYAVLDPEGSVHPYAKTLSIRRPRGAVLTTAEAIGGCTGVSPLRVGTVVTTRYEAGARWQPEGMTPGQTVLALLDNTVAARARPEDAVRILKRAVAGALGLKGPRGDADAVVTELVARTEAPA
jgi:hypothetical protein